MDPNEALRRLRELFADNSVHSAEDTAFLAQELFEGLDQWLSNGGFLPTAWERPAPSAADPERNAGRMCGRCGADASVPVLRWHPMHLGNERYRCANCGQEWGGE